MVLVGCGDTATDTATDTTKTTTPEFFPIVILPNDSIILTNAKIRLNVSGGKPPYTFSMESGPGSIGTTGIYIADSITGNVIIMITDSVGKTAEGRLRVVKPLALLPTTVQINVDGNFQFETKGGVAPYFYQIVTGGGIISPIGQYFAGTTPTTVLVKVVDVQGNEATATVQTNSPVQINPSSANINRGDKYQFTSSFGFAPYNYRIISGNGSMASLTGVFTAPAVAGTSIIQSVDSIGTLSSSIVTINNLPLSLNNSNPMMQVNQSFEFKVIGGLAPYTFSFNGSGNLGSLLPTGTYFSPSVQTVDNIKVVDSEGTIFAATITVNPALTISPNTKTTVVNRAEIFFPSGGIPPYTFQLLSGSGSVNPSSGVFVAPANPGTSVVRLQDSLYNYADVVITINPDITISPVNPQIMVGNQVNFLGGGGVPPFDYSLLSGPGSIDNSGLYTANGGAGSAVIQVKDSKNTVKTTTVFVAAQIKFVEDPITVKSGNTKNILISGGVPPYTIQFRDTGGNLTNFSPYGSTLVNNNYTLNSSPLSIQSGSAEIQISKSAHGLIIGEQIQLRALSSCNVFTSAELNINVTVDAIIDLNTFVITGTKLATATTNCGGLSGFYKRLSGSLPYKAGIVSSLIPETLVVRDSLLNEVSKIIYIDGGLMAQYDLNLATGITNKFGQGCQTQSITNLVTSANVATVINCPNTDPWFLQDQFPPSNPSDPANTTPPPVNYLKMGQVGVGLNLPMTTVAAEFNTYELWFYWDGYRLSSNFSRMDANLIGMSSGLNIAFMSIKTGPTTYDKSLCFNTINIAPYDCYGIRNIDSFVSTRWTHYVFVVNNGDISKNKIYLNGVDQSLVNIGAGTSASLSQTNNLSALGSTYNSPVSSGPTDTYKVYVGGKLGFMKVFNRQLTPDEVSTSYNLNKSRFQYFGAP